MTNETIIDYVLPEREEDSIFDDDDYNEEDEVVEMEYANYRISEDYVDNYIKIQRYNPLASRGKIKVYFEGKEVTNWKEIKIEGPCITVKQRTGINGWKDIVDGQESYKTPVEAEAHVTD